MEDYKEQVLNLADKLSEKETGNIKSMVGVVNISYGLIEEIFRRNKKKLKKEGSFNDFFKKDLYTYMLKDIVIILEQKNLVDESIAGFILDNIENQNVNMFLEIIEDITDFWDLDILKGCICKRGNRKAALKKLKI